MQRKAVCLNDRHVLRVWTGLPGGCLPILSLRDLKHLAQSCDITYRIDWQKWRKCSNWLTLKFFLPCVPHLAIACLLDLLKVGSVGSCYLTMKLRTIQQETLYALILSVLDAFSIIARIHGLTNWDGSGLTTELSQLTQWRHSCFPCMWLRVRWVWRT